MISLSISSFRSTVSAFALVLGAASLPACAQTPEAPTAFEHTFKQGVTITSGELAYQMHWDSLILDKNEGDASTTISGTSYLLECECERPVVFLFNGGPGASSSPLHFALGPKSRADGKFEDNSVTLLDTGDLVFIDPVETGFSRSGNPDGTSPYLSIDRDAEAVARFIKAWLSEHDRDGDKVFIVGQSYGGYRLTQLLPHVEELNIGGLFMVSPMLNAAVTSSDLGNVFNLPTFAATAWRVGKSDIEAETEDEAWDVAREFAETDYLIALQKGDAIEPDLAEETAEKLAAMTGLSIQSVLDADLRINIQYFLENVLAEENKLVSRLNTGNIVDKAPPANADRPAAANDPSLGLGRSNKIISQDIADYLLAGTGAACDDGYRSLNLDANFAWNWKGEGRSYSPALTGLPQLAAFLKDHPDTKLLVFGGYRDLAIALLGLDYQLSHAGLPPEQVTLMPMLGGHSPFDEPDVKPAFADAIRTAISNALDTE
ncbi:MAG: hypothetical protein CMK07_12050 [Ponticaulis sp.]|nr:hypothetical protein [Ponticaulis sp.]